MTAGSDTSASRPVVTAHGAALTPASLPSDACSGIQGNAESVALFDRACDGGDAQGCFEAAKGYLCGTGVPKDLRKAADRSARSCDKDTRGCATAGLIVLAIPDATPAEADRGARMLQRGCDSGDIAACNNLAIAKLQGSGIPQDMPGALALFEKLCDKGNVPSCGNAAMIHIAGVGVPRNVDRGTTMGKTACEKGDATACNALGYAAMMGDVASPVLAAHFFEKACSLGQAAACDNLGQLYAGGAGVDVDMVRAERLFRAACDAGNAASCTHLATLVAAREQTPPPRGAIFYEPPKATTY
jgi:TPR repeat protein